MAVITFVRLPAFSQTIATGSYTDGAHRHGLCTGGHCAFATSVP